MGRALHPAQQRAHEHVAAYAWKRRAAARDRLDEIARMADLPEGTLEAVRARIAAHASVALHFHPDRVVADGRTIAAALLADGVYRSQFETGVSAGSVTAHAGGARDRWEHLLFGGAYHGADVTAAHRPKYGALDLLGAPDGPAPRFGSCRFVLRPAVSARATFTYLDSHDDPRDKGTLDELDLVLAALFTESFTREVALGEPDLPPRSLVDRLLALGTPAAAGRAPGRSLDHYVEAQVHGEVRLARDVERLVVDASFRDTETGSTLLALADRHGVPLAWHPGFVLAVADVPSTFRGAAMPGLAARIARGGIVDAAAIGVAAQDVARAPAAWADRGPPEAVLQELKLLWHVLVRFGAPRG